MRVEESENQENSAEMELDVEFVDKASSSCGVTIATQVDLGHHMQPCHGNTWILVRLEPVASDKSLYTVRMSTNVPLLKLKTSISFRTFGNWYFLQSFIQNAFPQIKMRPLPPRHVLWIKDRQTKLEEISEFIKQILYHKHLMLNRIVQLFLQSSMSTDFIQENIDGGRHDEVASTLEIKKEAHFAENISKLNLAKVSGQMTYHGPTESHKSVQNLFPMRKKSIVINHNPYMQPLTEDNFDPDTNFKYRGIVY